MCVGKKYFLLCGKALSNLSNKYLGNPIIVYGLKGKKKKKKSKIWGSFNIPTLLIHGYLSLLK